MVEPFRPMVDGVEFPKQPLDMFQDGDWHTNIDVIIGTNRQELGIISAKFQDRKITEKLYIVQCLLLLIYLPNLFSNSLSCILMYIKEFLLYFTLVKTK